MVYSTPSGWVVEYCNHRVEKEIEAMAEDIRAKFASIVQLIEEYGLPQVHEPYVKHLQGKLWEMRIKGQDGIARAVYVAAFEKKVVVLHGFVKKTQKTPQDAIALAMKRAMEAGLL